MQKTYQVQGKTVVIRGTRCFAVPKQLGRAERIHAAQSQSSNYQRCMKIPDTKVIGTRNISNKQF